LDEGGWAVAVGVGAGNVAGMGRQYIPGFPFIIHLLPMIHRKRTSAKREVVVVQMINNMSQIMSMGPMGGEPV
jgi:hypothetical protein